MNALAAFTHRRKFFFDMNFPRIVHRRGKGLADDANTVFRHERRCIKAFRCMKLAKRTGQQLRILFRFATHIPHSFLIITTENHRRMQKATLFSHANGKNWGVRYVLPKAAMLENKHVQKRSRRRPPMGQLVAKSVTPV
jgi:hypothetical protein